MKSRCYDPNETSYRNYGGRGIAVSDEWLDFRNFERDMGPTYQLGLSLERVDNEKGYSKENCAWIALNEQSRNRRNVRHFEHLREMKTVRAEEVKKALEEGEDLGFAEFGCSDGFWYALTQGGYFAPEKALSDPEQVAAVKAAQKLLQDLERNVYMSLNPEW